ncbi:MAG: hypothetical protein IH865_09465 [Chloroflexi bacterium]|nr:hypothetical protein [Chloroflexota bacterium]
MLGHCTLAFVRLGRASRARLHLSLGAGPAHCCPPSFDVIQHYAPTGTEPTYDASFDRGPSAGPNVWNMTAPDGVIDLTNDIFGVIQQYLHDCR